VTMSRNWIWLKNQPITSA